MELEDEQAEQDKALVDIVSVPMPCFRMKKVEIALSAYSFFSSASKSPMSNVWKMDT